MFSIAETYILYNLLLVVCPLLCYLSDRTDVRWLRYAAYFLLLVVSVVRFDIGADYENHSIIFKEKGQLLQNGFGAMTIIDFLKPEPMIYLMIYLTKDLEMSYVYVFALISLFSILFVYKAFDHYKVHTLGIFMFVVSFVYFQMWDWSRQGLAISIFLYATKYIEQGNFRKYMVLMVFAVLSHFSSVVLIPFYFAGKWSPTHKNTPFFLALFLLFSIAAGVIGIFSNLHDRITSMIPFYSQLYAGSEYTQNGVGTYRSTTYILSMLTFCAVVFLSSEKHMRLTSLLALGALIYAVAGGNLNFIRMAWPLTSLVMIIVPLSFRDVDIETYNKRYVRYLYILLLYVAVFEGVYIKANFRDVVPYETIFSKEFDQQSFRIRAY